jgi:hypothetical protein
LADGVEEAGVTRRDIHFDRFVKRQFGVRGRRRLAQLSDSEEGAAFDAEIHKH